MIIKELYIKNFGKFSEKNIRFHDGMQVISGENEYGKSTIHAFIRAMLFGMERGRGRAAAKDAFTRYQPWDNPGHYAGMMRFVCGGRTFRLERTFDRYTKQASLVCEDDGEELSVEHGDLAMLLGGLTEGMFDNTVSVGQMKVEPGQELIDAVGNYAANYCETGDGDVDLGNAFQILKEKRRNAEKALGEEQYETEIKRNRILQECTYLERDMGRLRGEYEERQTELEQLENIERKLAARTGTRGRLKDGMEGPGEDTTNIGAGEPEQEGGKGISGRSLLYTGAGGVFAGAAGLLWGMALGGAGNTASGEGLSLLSASPVSAVAGVILFAGAAALAAGIILWIREKNRNRQQSAELKNSRSYGEIKNAGEDSDVSVKQLDEIHERKQRLEWEMERVRNEWKEKEIRCGNLREQSEEMPDSEAIHTLKRRIQALALAEAELKKASEETGGQTARALNRKASKIFAEITGGRYRGMEIGTDFHISVWDGMRKISAERLSRGTAEQIYFAVRMAAADMLLEEPMPVILDDVFAFYDDNRLLSALKWLSQCGKQVIIFSCHKREQAIVKREDFS